MSPHSTQHKQPNKETMATVTTIIGGFDFAAHGGSNSKFEFHNGTVLVDGKKVAGPVSTTNVDISRVPREKRPDEFKRLMSDIVKMSAEEILSRVCDLPRLSRTPLVLHMLVNHPEPFARWDRDDKTGLALLCPKQDRKEILRLLAVADSE